MPIYWLCGFIGGIYLIIAGIKYLKLLVSVMGLLCLTLVVLPIVCWGTGINAEFLLTPVSNFSLFSLSGLIAGLIGLWSKIKGISNMGFTIFTCGVLGAPILLFNVYTRFTLYRIVFPNSVHLQTKG